MVTIQINPTNVITMLGKKTLRCDVHEDKHDLHHGRLPTKAIFIEINVVFKEYLGEYVIRAPLWWKTHHWPRRTKPSKVLQETIGNAARKIKFSSTRENSTIKQINIRENRLDALNIATNLNVEMHPQFAIQV